MQEKFRRILCPIDFDDNSMKALDTAADLARDSNGTVFVLHVVPMIITATGMPVYSDLYKGRKRLLAPSCSRSRTNSWAGSSTNS